MDEVEPMFVKCGAHGERVAAVVCKHMLKNEPAPAGFIENCNEPNDLQAWCYWCEEKFDREGGMTDAFKEFNGMAVVCIDCYEDAKVRHAIPKS